MKNFLIGLLVAFVAFLAMRVWQISSGTGGAMVNPLPQPTTFDGLSIPMPTQGEQLPAIDPQPALDVYATVHAAQTQMIESNNTHVAEFVTQMASTPIPPANVPDRNGWQGNGQPGTIGTHDTGSSDRPPRSNNP